MLTYWSYVFLALTHRFFLLYTKFVLIRDNTLSAILIVAYCWQNEWEGRTDQCCGKRGDQCCNVHIITSSWIWKHCTTNWPSFLPICNTIHRPIIETRPKCLTFLNMIFQSAIRGGSMTDFLVPFLAATSMVIYGWKAHMTRFSTNCPIKSKYHFTIGICHELYVTCHWSQNLPRAPTAEVPFTNIV